MNDNIKPNFGILLVDSPGSTFEIAQLGKLGQHVESVGFHRVGISDHSIAAHVKTYDPMVCLATLASHTTRIRIATQVLVLPLRHPIQVAHAFTTLDQISNGRMELGIGVGGEWPSEFNTLGIDIKTRGKRTDESLAIIKSIWEENKVDHSGVIFDINGVRSLISPIQNPSPPIVIGGRSDKALLRAARFGSRWDGIFLEAPKFSSLRDRLNELAIQTRREVTAGMVMWVSVGEPKSSRERVAHAMENFYQVSFERFARYALWGTKNEIHAKIHEFVAEGASDISLIPVGNLGKQINELSFLNESY